MIPPVWLLTLPVVFPLGLAVCALLLPPHLLRTFGLTAACASALTSLPPLLWVWRAGPLHQSPGGWGAPLGIDLYLDGQTAVLLLFTAGIGWAVSAYAAAYFPSGGANTRSRGDLFWPLWLVAWGGMNSLSLSLDLFHFYVVLELISIAGTGMILIAGTPGATRAALQYQLQALVAGLLYLLGVGLLYQDQGTLDLQQIADGLQPTPWVAAGTSLMLVGLLVKSALFPLHSWLPRAHADAPAPVSAVLSGLVVTAAWTVLLRFWFAGFHRVVPYALPILLAMLGGTAVCWGGLLALRQDRLKRVLAFSTVSQVGYLFLVFALASGSTAADREPLRAAAMFLALSNGFSKASAFLVAGILQKSAGTDELRGLSGVASREPLAVVVLGLAFLNLIGGPPSLGFWGKWMLLGESLRQEAWGLALAWLLGSLLSGLYLFRVLEVLVARPSPCPCPPAATLPWKLLLPAFALALASFLPTAGLSPLLELLRIGFHAGASP